MKVRISKRELSKLLDDVIYLEKIMEEFDVVGEELPVYEYDEELEKRLSKYEHKNLFKKIFKK